MKAIGTPHAGALDRIGPFDIEMPALTAGSVQVRVVASALNPADVKVLGGQFAGRVLHGRTRPLISGYDFSGVVEAKADGVDDLSAGDEVFGFLPYSSSNKQGAFAEHVVVPRNAIARKPAGIGHDVAAASATPAVSALQALRDKGTLPTGGKLLVIGAAGGVGSLAVVIAKAWAKAHVTAVCSTYAVDYVRELGADDVIDRRVTEPSKIEGAFDVIFDSAAAYSFTTFRHALARGGAYVTTLPGPALLTGKLLSAFSSKRCHTFLVKPVRADLEIVGELLAAGMKVSIDSHFPVRDLSKALERHARGEVRGRIVIDVERGW
ncbi:MAG TPA: NAD(P)-dependent alcohol dehydrogenase [Kofleriaceae bacterium]|nr:NAD(P)-dependent alcohol dehydrogenase [Kofleriaceae bacterium]